MRCGRGARHGPGPSRQEKQVYRMPLEGELRDVIGALQSEVEFEAVVSELGAAGIDRARISFLAQEGASW